MKKCPLFNEFLKTHTKQEIKQLIDSVYMKDIETKVLNYTHIDCLHAKIVADLIGVTAESTVANIRARGQYKIEHYLVNNK